VNNPGLDVSVANASAGTTIQVDTSNNYWGGGAPVPGDVTTSGNVKLNSGAHLTTDPQR
jgi:hypothetical protein